MLDDKRHNVLFVGYQAKGAIGCIIQKYGPANNGNKLGYVDLDGQRIPIKVNIHTISGYSANAGQKDLLNCIERMWFKPNIIRLIHVDKTAKETFKERTYNRHTPKQILEYLKIEVL